MALYPTDTIHDPVTSDVNQLVNIFNGKHDIGIVNLAPALSAPSSSNFTLALQSGTTLGIGQNNYQFSYVTGQYKADGITAVQTGETLPSGTVSITTTSGNQSVKITLPTVLPASVIAINIYRTSLNGTDYKLIATVKAGNTSYIDSTVDGSRGSQTPTTSNTTGTILTQYVRANYKMEIVPVTLFTNGASNTAQANGTFANAYANLPYIGPMNLGNTSGVSYSDDIVYPYFYNVTTTGFSVKIKAEGTALLGTSTPTNIILNCLVFGN